MENVKIKVISQVGHAVTVNIPDLRFSRTWPAKGASVSIDKEVLEDMMYDIGFRNMLESGMLYIEDLAVKKSLGLEPEEATEPQNIIILSDKDKQYYLTGLSLVGFKDKVKKLSKVQLEELAEYAIDHKIMDVEKNKVIKEACGRDVIKAVQLVEQDKEA